MSSALLTILFGILGGLAIFIYGANLMGEGLQKISGERIRHILGMLTSNPVLAVLVGTLVAFILQSSSATMIMTVGFVSAGLLTLPQAIGVIMGASLGTTLTVQLVAFPLSRYAYAIAAIGFILFYFFKGKQVTYIGRSIFGFGLLFTGLTILSDAMNLLARDEFYSHLLLELSKYPVVGLLVGTLLTVVVQNSSATAALLQSLASQPAAGTQALLDLPAALPVLFGDAVGIAVIALLSTVGARVHAKRLAITQALFTIFGVLVFIGLIPIIIGFVQLISPKGPEYQVIARQIANAHTTVHVLTVLICLPFTWLLAKIATFLVKGEKPEAEQSMLYLDDHILDNPSIAMDLATMELSRMATLAHRMMESARTAFTHSDMEAARKVSDMEDIVDMLQKKITKYLSTILSRCELTERQAIRLSGLMRTANDIERIGDHCKNISEFAQHKETEHVPFSEEALSEINEAFKQLDQMTGDTIRALQTGDTSLANKVLSEENEVDHLEHQLRARHIERLNQGQCNPQATITFIELIHNLERIADHCNNIAEAVLEDCNAQPEQGNEST